MATVTERRETPGEAIDRLCREHGRRKGWLAEQLGILPQQLSARIAGKVRISLAEAKVLGAIFDEPYETFLHADSDGSAPGGAVGSFS